MFYWQLTLKCPSLHMQDLILQIFIKYLVLELIKISQLSYRTNSPKYLRIPRGGYVRYFSFTKVSLRSLPPYLMFRTSNEILLCPSLPLCMWCLCLGGFCGVECFGFVLFGFLVWFGSNCT